MAFEGLTEKISATFKKLRGKGRLKEADVKAVKAEVASILAEVKAEHSYSDPEAEFHFEKAARCPERYIQDSVIRRALKAIISCPHGVARMSDSMPGLTETSTNLAIVKCEKGHLKVQSLMRSAVDSSKANLAEQLRAVFELAGVVHDDAASAFGNLAVADGEIFDDELFGHNNPVLKSWRRSAAHRRLWAFECAAAPQIS